MLILHECNGKDVTLHWRSRDAGSGSCPVLVYYHDCWLRDRPRKWRLGTCKDDSFLLGENKKTMIRSYMHYYVKYRYIAEYRNRTHECPQYSMLSAQFSAQAVFDTLQGYPYRIGIFTHALLQPLVSLLNTNTAQSSLRTKISNKGTVWVIEPITRHNCPSFFYSISG
jgi:hypothetical protein